MLPEEREATAVVFMIIPILAVNLSLVRDLSREELRTCSRRFGPLIGAALVGTVVGMAVLSRIPTAPLPVDVCFDGFASSVEFVNSSHAEFVDRLLSREFALEVSTDERLAVERRDAALDSLPEHLLHSNDIHTYI